MENVSLMVVNLNVIRIRVIQNLNESLPTLLIPILLQNVEIQIVKLDQGLVWRHVQNYALNLKLNWTLNRSVIRISVNQVVIPRPYLSVNSQRHFLIFDLQRSLVRQPERHYRAAHRFLGLVIDQTWMKIYPISRCLLAL